MVKKATLRGGIAHTDHQHQIGRLIALCGSALELAHERNREPGDIHRLIEALQRFKDQSEYHICSCGYPHYKGPNRPPIKNAVTQLCQLRAGVEIRPSYMLSGKWVVVTEPFFRDGDWIVQMKFVPGTSSEPEKMLTKILLPPTESSILPGITARDRQLFFFVNEADNKLHGGCHTCTRMVPSTVTIPQEDDLRLQAIAKERGISVSDLLRNIIEERLPVSGRKP